MSDDYERARDELVMAARVYGVSDTESAMRKVNAAEERLDAIITSLRAEVARLHQLWGADVVHFNAEIAELKERLRWRRLRDEPINCDAEIISRRTRAADYWLPLPPLPEPQ